MILILLLIILISCVCAGHFFVNVKQTKYQEKENDNVTLEWTFTTRSNKSPNLVLITCDRSTNNSGPTVLHLEYGVEVSELQDEQFSGRVQWDRNVLREGRLRLHVSRLRTNDSGRYKCLVQTRHDQGDDQCWLNVTASVAQELHTTPTENPEPQDQERFYMALGAGIMSAVIIVVLLFAMAAALLGIRENILVITVVVAIAVLFLIPLVLCSKTAKASLLWGGLILFVFAASSYYCICTLPGFSHSNSESGSDSRSKYKTCPTNFCI